MSPMTIAGETARNKSEVLCKERFISGCNKNFFPLYANILSPIFWHRASVLDNLIRSMPAIY